MKKKLTNNLGWKIVSLLASIVLWMVVNTVSNPSVTQTYYNIPVQLLNTDQITSSGRVYKVLDKTDVIPKVVIKAPRSVISEIDDDDIIATADVDDISKLDTISINLTTNNYSDQINSIKGSVDTVKLEIENKKTRLLALNSEIIGTVKDGHMVGDTTISQNVVNITGPESLVNSVDSAIVQIDVSGFSSDIETNAEIKLINEDGELMNPADFTMNIKSVGVQVVILEYKEIPVNFEMTGKPATGFVVRGNVESDKATVTVSGKSSVLKNIDEINVPKEAIDITDHKTEFVTQINIKGYLPDGVSLVDANDAMYTVTVHIEAEQEKNIEITTEDISIVDVPDGYQVTAAVDTGVSASFTGVSSDVSGLSLETIKPTVNVKKWMASKDMDTLEEGFYTVELSFSIPERVVVASPVKAVIHVVKETQE